MSKGSINWIDAMAKGKFSERTNATFSAPGWGCRGDGERPNAHSTCTQPGATLRFTA